MSATTIEDIFSGSYHSHEIEKGLEEKDKDPKQKKAEK